MTEKQSASLEADDASGASELTGIERRNAVLPTASLQTAISNSASFSCIATDATELLCYLLDDAREKPIWNRNFFRNIAANQDKFPGLQPKSYVRYDALPLETSQRNIIQSNLSLKSIWLIEPGSTSALSMTYPGEGLPRKKSTILKWLSCSVWSKLSPISMAVPIMPMARYSRSPDRPGPSSSAGTCPYRFTAGRGKKFAMYS